MMFNTIQKSSSEEHLNSSKSEDSQCKAVVDNSIDDKELDLHFNGNDSRTQANANNNIIEEVLSQNTVSKVKKSSSSLPKEALFKSAPPSSS